MEPLPLLRIYKEINFPEIKTADATRRRLWGRASHRNPGVSCSRPQDFNGIPQMLQHLESTSHRTLKIRETALTGRRLLTEAPRLCVSEIAYKKGVPNFVFLREVWGFKTRGNTTKSGPRCSLLKRKHHILESRRIKVKLTALKKVRRAGKHVKFWATPVIFLCFSLFNFATQQDGRHLKCEMLLIHPGKALIWSTNRKPQAVTVWLQW